MIRWFSSRDTLFDGPEGFLCDDYNDYGRGSNSMSPFRMARMAA
jgi:hypothetical protein